MSGAQGTPAVAAPARPPRWTFDQAVKDPAVEELVDLHFHRRLAFALVLRPIELLGLRVTPMQLTVLAGLLGILAGVAYWRADADPRFYAFGTLLLLGSIALDCADGMLARLRGGGTHLGMLVDGYCDTVVGVAVWTGTTHAATAHLQGWWVWPSAIFMLVCIVVHCAMYDGMKNAYARLSLPREQRTALPTDREPTGSAAQRLFMRVYGGVYGGVSTLTGGGLERRLEALEPRQVRAALAWPMRLGSFLGLGTHLALVYGACLVGLAAPRTPFWIATATVSVGLNVLMLVTVFARRRAARRLLDQTTELA